MTLSNKTSMGISFTIAYASLNLLTTFIYQDYDTFAKKYSVNGVAPVSEERYYEKMKELYGSPIMAVLVPLAHFEFKADYEDFMERKCPIIPYNERLRV